ncbi:transcriptional repressor LexA [bacterium]|nr:transcriptional repressor LexA [bacterium]
MNKKDGKMTAAQKLLLGVIISFRERTGYSPTNREIAQTLGISAASVHEQIERMERNGHLTKRSGKARSVMPVNESHTERGRDSISHSRLVAIPLLGDIAAGEPIFADENHEESIMVDESTIGTGQFYALRVRGDSMKNADILDGDLVVIRRQPVAEHGEIVAALIDAEATVKRLNMAGDGVFLMPENESYEPIDVTYREDFRIMGKVVSIVKT